MRVSNLVKNLNRQTKTHTFTLVLPPWGRIGYHWGPYENRIPWSKFFNIKALSAHVPVIEFNEFIDKHQFIDDVWYLQAYAEGWGEKFEEKNDDRDCIDAPVYQSNADKTFSGWFFGYGQEVRAKNFKCVS